MGLFSNITKGIIKNGAKIAKQLDEINEDTSKKISKNTSIFDMQREEILRAAEEKKRKIIEEERKKREEAELKKIEAEQKKKEEEAQQQQTAIEKYNDEKKKKDEEDGGEKTEESDLKIKTQEEDVEDAESADETYKDDGTDYTKVLAEQDEQKYQAQKSAVLDDYRSWIEDYWNKKEDKTLKDYGNWFLKGADSGRKLAFNGLLREFRDIKHGVQMSINPTKEKAREILNKEASKEQINNENSVQYQLDKQDELQRKTLADEEGGLTQEEIAAQLDEISKSEEGQLLKDWNQIQTELYEPSQRLNELTKLYEDAIDKKNYGVAENLLEQIKPLRVVMLRKTYEYAFGETIEGETEEDIFNKVKQLSGNKKLDWNAFLEGQVQQLIDKENSAKDVQYKIMSLVTQFEIRSDYNVGELPVKKFLSVLENYGLVIGSEQEAAIRAPYMSVQTELQEYDAKIKKARESGNEEEALRLEKEKQNYKQGMSWFTDFMNDAFVEILQGRTDNIGRTSEAVLNFFQSKEIEDLREFLTDPALFAQFEKDGVVDYKGLMKYLKNSEVVKKFGALEGAYSMSAIKTDRKAISTNLFRDTEYNLFENYNVQDKGTQYLAGKYADVVKKYLSEGGEIREGGYIENEFTDEYIKDVLGSEYDFSVMTDKQKAKIRADLQNYYREYQELKGDSETYEHMVNNYINGLEESGLRKGDRYTDDIALRIGRLDPEYAMSQYARLGSSLEGLADMIQANPRATFHTSIAVALPFVGGVGAAGLLEGLGLSTVEGLEVSNILKTTMKAGAAIFGEVAEGQVMNAILESQSYGGEPEPIWNLLDVGIGTIKAIPYIKFGLNLGKFKTFKIAENGKSLEKALEDAVSGVKNQHGSAELKLSQLTDADKSNLNAEFKREGIGNIVKKDMADYLKEDLSIDWEKLYKDYSTNRLTYLGLGEDATNKNILKKIQQQAFAKELDTMDKRMLDFLYKKAQKWFGDKTIVKDLLKEGGQKRVITERLSGELNTLKRIGNIKAAYATTVLAENAGDMNKALNEKFGGIIKSLEEAKAKATRPEQIEFLDEAISDARTLWNNQRLLVLSFNEQNFDKALQLNKILTDKFNEKYNTLSRYWKDEWGNGLVGTDGNILSVVDGGISSIEKRLVDKWLAGDKEGVVREILGNQEEYEKIGVRVYNAEEYKNAIKDMSNNMLTDGQKNRLGQILDVLNKVNNNSISIIELPDSLRKTITSLQGFMGYIERGGKQETIITLGSSLVGGVKNGKFNNIKVLCHELGHTLFGSLSRQVKSQLVAGLLKTLNGKEMGPDLLRKLVGGLSEGRINVLLDLYKKKDKTEFVEELAADMMSNAIVKGIKGDENAIQSVGKVIIDKMAKGEKINEFIDSDQPFQIVGNKFVDMLVTLNNAIETSAGGYKELRGIMHYIAATILEGGEVETKAAKNWKDARKNMVFGRKGKFYNYMEKWADEQKLIKEAKEYNTIEDFINAKTKDFRDQHRAPGNWDVWTPENAEKDGADTRLDWLFDRSYTMVPNDMLDYPSGIRFWRGKWSDDSYRKFVYYNNQYKNNKDFKIRVYRAVPNDTDVKGLIPGDWVTLNKDYADSHGLARFGEGEYKIIEEDVPIKELWRDGNDINEFGYDTLRDRDYLIGIWNKAHPDVKYSRYDVLVPYKEQIDDWLDKNNFSDLIINKFGETSDPAKAIFITSDGRMVNGFREGFNGNEYFDLEHLPIIDDVIFGNKKSIKQEGVGSRAAKYVLNRLFEKEGLIRMRYYPYIKEKDITSLYLSLNHDLTKQQEQTLRNIIYNFNKDMGEQGKIIIDNGGDGYGEYKTIYMADFTAGEKENANDIIEAINETEKKSFYNDIMVEQLNKITLDYGGGLDGTTGYGTIGNPNFFAYEEKQKIVSKADYNYAKENADKVATMDNNITEFEVAKVYSTQLVEIAVQNEKLSVDDLSQLLSTKWLDTDLYDTILKNLEPKYQKRFMQAMSWAEERKGTAMNTLLQFWKDGKLDLTKEINGVRFSDVLANLAPNITKDGYVEWAGVDLIKYLNGGNKEVYNKLFTDFMRLLENEYDEKVVTDVIDKFNKAGIKGSSMAEQYVNFTNKVQDSIKQTALNAGMSEELANSLTEDVVSRLFAGSFYYIGNLYYIHESSRFDTLVDDMAYGLLLKNKNDAQGATFNKLYNDILTQYEKQGTFDAGFANWLSKVNKAEAGDIAGLDPTDFRWNRYWKNVFNRLATRTHGFIEDALKGIGNIDLDQRYWISFINKIDNRYSQVKAIIGKRVADAGLDGTILNLDGLNQARSIEEVANVYIQALREADNVKLIEAMPDKADREALISQLEDIKSKGFTNKDYNLLLSDLETKYLSYSRDGQDLTNYFRASLTADEVSELNRIEESFAKSKNEIIPATWTEDLKKDAEGIDEIFEDEEVQKQLGTLTEEMNNWNKLVEEGELGGYNAILDWMLKDDALKAFFNIENEYKFKDTVKKLSINSNMTTTSMKSAKKLVIKVNSDDNIAMGGALKDFIGKYVNVTTVAAKDADVGRIIQSAIDFVDRRRVYVGDGALADFFKLIGADGKDSYSMKAVINQIIKVLEEEGVRKGATASQIFKDISNSYSFRFKTRMSTDGDVITKAGKRKRTDGTAVKFTWAFNTDSEKYRAAIDAYVDVLAQRHSTYGWFKLEEISDGTKQYVNELDQILSSKLDKSPKSLSLELGAKEANKLQGLKGYWLGTSVDDLHKLDETAAVWHPDLFNNFLYKAYAQSSESFGKGDWLIKNIRRKGENVAANAMYFIFYNTVFGASAASQQIVTNTIEIASKTMSELSEIPVDPKTYNDLRDLVGTLIPSEIMRKEGRRVVANRAELDLPGRTGRLGERIKNFASKTSALTWADKVAEGEVIKYALVSSLMDLGLNGESTKELVSKVLAKMADAPNVLKLSDGTDIMELERIFRTDPSKIKGQAKAIVDRLKSEGKLTDNAGRAAYRYIIELNELTDPLRYAAKQANFKKNAFFQISNIPELTQNIIAGQAGPANMRFINWASRKAGEYAFNIADAITRKDWEQLYKYGNSLMLRGLFATKIYAQVNKATNDTGGVNYREFMKNVFLPYAVFNMSFLSAFDLIEETARDSKELGGMSGLLNSMYQGLFGFSDNLKGRLSYAYLYWRGQYWNIKNGINMLNEKEAASDYFSGPLSNIPVVNYIEEMVSKAASNRVTKYFNTKISGIYGNSPYDVVSQNSLVNMIFNANVTQDAVNNKRQQDKANKLMYQEDGFSFLKDGQLTLGLNDFTRDSKYAYMAYNKFLTEKGLDDYMKLGTNYTELRKEYDTLYGQQKFYTSLQGLGVDVEEAKNLGQMDEELWEQDWSDLAGYERLSEIKQLSATYWADSVLNIAILQSASLKGLLDAGEGLTTAERKEFTDRVNRLTADLIAEVEAQDAVNNKMLYAKAYDNKFIENMVKKYGNTYGEEMVIAASIKAMASGYKSQLTKDAKKIHGKGNYYQKWLKQEGGADEIAIKVADYKNGLVEQFYPTLTQGNQMIPNTMMHTHASMREDNPLSSKLSLNSALGAPIDVEWTKRNVMYQGLGTLGLDSASAILTTKVLNSSSVSEKDKVDFCKDAIEYANKQGPMLADLTKAAIAIPMLKHYTELYNTDPSVFDDNSEMFHDAMNMLTVSRPLSDEDIKQEVRESIFKSKGSGSSSGSKGRKGSISFNKPARDLTKFQAFKRQFEQNVMGQEPLSRIAYKATKTGITPIQLSVGEAQEIDNKYTFIKPKQPESEKTPDIVVKQVKTSKSTYSGKSIKQSNIYKVKRVI